MSVDCVLHCFVGIKGGYYDFRFFKNKADINLKYENDLDKIKNIVYTDYLSDGYIYDFDGMGGDYSFIGKEIFSTRELYVTIDQSFTTESMQKIRQEVIQDFKNLDLDFKEEDVKLHIFTHFS